MRINLVISDIIQIINRSHDDLQNLGVDDHTQYLDTGGVRPPINIISGADAAKPATCYVGDIYFAVDTNILYTCKTTNVWTQVIPADHAARHQDGGADEVDASNLAGVISNILTTQGDIAIRGAALIERLAIGTALQVLRVNAGATALEWGTPVSISDIELGFVESEDLQNSNDAAKSTTSTPYVKLKEVLLNADLAKCRIKFGLRRIAGGVYACNGAIYKNGVLIGTIRTTAETTVQTYSEDFTGFVSGDLIQIYARANGSLPLETEVSNMRFYYSEDVEIDKIGDYTLDTSIDAIKPVAAISITNQDP